MSCCIPKKRDEVVLKSTVKENKKTSAVEALLSYKVERVENVRAKDKKDNKSN
jgi:hypothetical protein